MATVSLKITGAGVRGVVGESLTPQLVTSFCAAFGNYCGVGPVLIGIDTRPSAPMVQQAAFAGLLSVGNTPVDVGVVPLPALMLPVRQAGAVGGLHISGRQRSIEWNALRFIGKGGSVLAPNQAAELTDLYHQGVYARVSADRIPTALADATTLARHRAAVLAAVDVDQIRARRFRVAVDCRNGAAAAATPAFLQALGCTVIARNADADHPFPEGPDPFPDNLSDLARATQETDADVGFAQDADGDRLTLIDERGAVLADDAAIALGADAWLARRPGPLVVSVATSRMVEAAAARHDCPVVRTRVGETHVVGRMQDVRAEIGGEGNGGVILAPVNPTRDSFVAMALVLQALARDRAPLSQHCAFLQPYFLARQDLQCPAREVAPALRWLEQVYRAHPLDRTDGLGVTLPDDRWLHVRPSGNEALLRLTAEARSRAQADQLLAEALEHLSPAG